MKPDSGKVMEEEVALRRYRPGDLRGLFELDEICFGEPFRFDLLSMRRFAEARAAISLIASAKGDDDEILGFVIVHLRGAAEARRGYVVTLDVSPERRRSGVAKRLMDEVERLAGEAGAGEMQLHVYTENAGAIRFYEALGYERTGQERGFYGSKRGVTLDALIYVKRL